jgi:circadian clock protein KaiB
MSDVAQRDATFVFRLYVAGQTQNSTQAVANLTAICREYLPGRHTIEIVDVFQQPLRAQADDVMMTPTLLKLEPLPVTRIVGSLRQHHLALQALRLVGRDRGAESPFEPLRSLPPVPNAGTIDVRSNRINPSPPPSESRRDTGMSLAPRRASPQPLPPRCR